VWVADSNRVPLRHARGVIAAGWAYAETVVRRTEWVRGWRPAGVIVSQRQDAIAGSRHCATSVTAESERVWECHARGAQTRTAAQREKCHDV